MDHGQRQTPKQLSDFSSIVLSLRRVSISKKSVGNKEKDRPGSYVETEGGQEGILIGSEESPFSLA